MPTYVYKCDHGHTFETIQSMADEALDTCEVCGAPAHRQLVAPAVHFKGSGFYTTDYARKGAGKSSNGSGGEGSGESKSDGKDSKSSDSGSKSEGKAASSSKD